MENKNPIQVADRLFGALELLAENGSAAVSEVSEALGLNKTTAHRVLTSLVYMGYARQDVESGRYEPSLKIVGLSNKIMNHLDIVQIVRPYLRKLMEMTNETVHFVERDGTDAVYIDKVESNRNGIQMVSRIGSRIPLYCSGVGKAMAPAWARRWRPGWSRRKSGTSGSTARSGRLPRIRSRTSGHLKRNWCGYATGAMRWIMRKMKTGSAASRSA